MEENRHFHSCIQILAVMIHPSEMPPLLLWLQKNSLVSCLVPGGTTVSAVVAASWPRSIVSQLELPLRTLNSVKSQNPRLIYSCFPATCWSNRTAFSLLSVFPFCFVMQRESLIGWFHWFYCLQVLLIFNLLATMTCLVKFGFWKLLLSLSCHALKSAFVVLCDKQLE